MTFDLISGLHMRIQTWHPPLRLCIHAKYYVKSGLINVLQNANKTKNMHLFSIRIANYIGFRRMLCAQFNFHIASFYNIVHHWTIDRVLLLDIHMQIFVTPNIDLVCGLVLKSLCGPAIPPIHNCFSQKSVDLSLPHFFYF